MLNLKEKYLIKKIEKKINKTFTSSAVPSGRQICEKQLFSMVDKMEKVDIDHEEIDTYLPQIYRKLEWLDKEDIIKRFVALEFNRFLDYYKNAPDLNVPEDNFKSNRKENSGRFDRNEKPGRSGWKDRSGKPDRKDRSGKPDWKDRSNDSESDFTKMIIDKGKNDGMYAAELMELINRNTPGKKIRLGKIELTKRSVIFEVPEPNSEQLMKALKDAWFGDEPVRVELLKEQKASKKKHFKG